MGEGGEEYSLDPVYCGKLPACQREGEACGQGVGRPPLKCYTWGNVLHKLSELYPQIKCLYHTIRNTKLLGVRS